jgi:MscS family membrane protein
MFNLGIVYGTPVKKIEKAIALVKGIIEKHPDCEKEPVVQFSEFKDSSLNILVIYYASNEKWFDTRHDINMAIKEAFDKNRIEFAFPTHTVYRAGAGSG